MPDPLSISASVAGLLALSLQSTEYLYNFYIAFKNQHEDLADIASVLCLLLSSLKTIDDLICRRTWRTNELRIKLDIEESLTRHEDVIVALQHEAQKFKKEPTDTWKEKTIKLGRQAAYPFKRSTLGGLKDNVCELRDNLALAIQSLELKEHQNTQDDIKELSDIVKSVHLLASSTNLQQWLKAPDAFVDFNAANAKRHPGTGAWLVTDSVYKSWLSQKNSFLWLYGFAGCGKSVLCSTVIQHAFRHRQSSIDSAVAFFFFTFTDESKQSASAALSALLFQLCGQIAGLEADLLRLKESLNDATPPVPALLAYLQQAVARYQHVYILLDAVDESPADTLRAEVLDIIHSMRQWQLPSLHLAVTSRDEPNIRDRLPDPSLAVGIQHVALKNDGIHKDISRFVSYQVDHDRQLQRWAEPQREKMKTHLTQYADGVFRWVECQLQSLRQCLRSEKHLGKCLRALPRSLDETYERMLHVSQSQDEARWMLSLLCHARRPMSVAEVTEALAIDIDDLGGYDPSSRLEGGADDLLRICPGLIEVVAQNRDSISHGIKKGKELVRIAHFSVQEYLLSDRIKGSKAKDFGLSGPLEHGQISRACLLYLEHDEFLRQPLSPDLVGQYAFADYAAQNWFQHYVEACDDIPEGFSKSVATFLKDTDRKERWNRLHDPDRTWRTSVVYSKPTITWPSSTYYASLLGLDNVLQYLLNETGEKVNAQGGKYCNVLQAASSGGYEQVAQMLLDRRADVNAQGGWYGNALQAASFGGHEQVVQILLDKGADVNAQGGRCGNALQAALFGGHEQVVQILLDKGVDVNAQGGKCGNALQAASSGGHEQVVQILLDKGADVNAQGGFYGNALQAALEGGHEQVMQILLDKGADVNAQGGWYGNALQAASFGGHEQVVQILLDKGADVNAQGGWYGNALQAALKGGHKQVVQILLDKGADVNAQGGFFGNALQAASDSGHKQVGADAAG